MGAFQQVWKSITGIPAKNMADKRYTFVNYTAEGKIDTSAAGGVAIGVLYEPNDVDEPAQVVASGFAFIKLGGAVTPGQEVEVGADGTAVAAAEGRPVGVAAVGGTAGDIATVFLG